MLSCMQGQVQALGRALFPACVCLAGSCPNMPTGSLLPFKIRYPWLVRVGGPLTRRTA